MNDMIELFVTVIVVIAFCALVGVTRKQGLKLCYDGHCHALRIGD